MIRVKICGLTRLEDAERAIDLGADAVGFVFWPGSPRAVTSDRVSGITARLPPFIARVGVFVDAEPAFVQAVVRDAGLDVAQLHGGETAPGRVIRAISLLDDRALEDARRQPASVTLLVDASDPVKRGGTGQLADWGRAATLARERPVILAGGITPENVAAAARQVRPWAIDVSSGVEDAPGIKNAKRLKALFDEVARLRAEGL